MILEPPKELEEFLAKCQRLTNNRFWFCKNYEFRYRVVNPADDDAEVHILVGVESRVLIILYDLSKICSSCEECVKAFSKSLNDKKTLDFLVNGENIEEEDYE